ncbi:hypothetical protein EPN96_01930 [bacterium]|nr:MAG: hypothetical protein EPN96_01930 [bacterium]
MGWILKQHKLLKELSEQSSASAKHISLRLPVITAAKISALCELYPTRTRTEVVLTLLENSLDEYGKLLTENEENAELRKAFEKLVDKYIAQYEKEVSPRKAFVPEDE